MAAVGACAVYAPQGNTTCGHTGINPNNDITHFDNIGVAFLTIFQSVCAGLPV